MNLLIIGGAGYIGSNVVWLFKQLDPKINMLILDNFSTGTKQALVPGVEWVEADVRNLDQLESIFQWRHFDAVLDFSALTVVSESTVYPLSYYEDNFIGTYNIIKCIKKYHVPNLMFSSTAAVYGNPVHIPVSEQDPKNPINPYGCTKLCSEMLIKDAAKAYEFNYMIFRYFNVAGASDNYQYGFFRKNPTLLIPALNNAILTGNMIHIYGDNYPTKDGTCIRDYIHVVDLANAHWLGLNWLIANKKSNIINLGSSNGFSVKEVLDCAIKLNYAPIKYDIKPARPGDPAILITDNNKTKEVLGWIPQKKLADMIYSDWEFRKSHFQAINDETKKEQKLC